MAVCVAMYGHDVPAFAQKPTAQSGRPTPAAPTPAPTRQASVASVSAPDAALLDTYCVSCHNDRLKTAGLSLQGLEFADVPAHAQIWEKVMRKVRSGEMPPVTARARLDAQTAAALVSYLETTLDRDAAAHPNPGRAPAHRLNRAEYSNAIRDLLAVDVTPGDWLPVDDSGYGFDNIAAVLSTSPALLERYMTAARRVSRLAVGDLDPEAGRRDLRRQERSVPRFAERAVERRPAVRFARRHVGSSTTSRSTPSTSSRFGSSVCSPGTPETRDPYRFECP